MRPIRNNDDADDDDDGADDDDDGAGGRATMMHCLEVQMNMFQNDSTCEILSL